MENSPFRVGTSWTEVTIASEVDVALTFRGYAPVLTVMDHHSKLEYQWFIGAKSIGETLENMRQQNGGYFSGLHLRICKASEDRFAGYLIEQIENTNEL